MYFEQKIYKLLNEEDVMDKVIKFKDAEGNEKEATVGGILKKGADHPAHDLAQKEYDNAQKGDDQDKPKAGPSIDVNPFDDKEDEPSAAPKGDDSQQSQAASETSDKILDILAKGNHRQYAPGSTAEADYIPEIRDSLNSFKDNGGTAEDLAKAILNRDPVDPSDKANIQNDIKDLNILMNLSNDIFDEPLQVNTIEYGKKRGLDVANFVEKYGHPKGPEFDKGRGPWDQKDSSKYHMAHDLYDMAKEQGLVGDTPAQDKQKARADEPDEPVSKDSAISNSLETIADAGERGADFSDPGVKDQVTSDFNSIKDAGGTVQDIADAVKDQAEYMDLENFELLDAAAQEIFGEPIPHGLSDDEIGRANRDESKQPFREHYNRLFKGRSVL